MTGPAGYLAPAWLQAAVDQRLALMEQAIGDTVTKAVGVFAELTGYTPDPKIDLIGKMMGNDIIMTPLTEPREGATREELDQWERRCDNCGVYCPEGQVFFTGHLNREFHGHQVIILFGACPLCKDTP